MERQLGRRLKLYILETELDSHEVVFTNTNEIRNSGQLNTFIPSCAYNAMHSYPLDSDEVIAEATNLEK